MSRRRGRRAWAPRIERVEARDLPSGVIAVLSSQGSPAHGRASAQADAPGDTVPNLVIDPVGTPTPREAARRAFRASFAGFYTTGPGRTDAEASQIYLRGVGRAKGILHADIQVRIVTPLDPSVPPAGASTIYDRNINGNGQLGFDLTADRVLGVDRFGRPTLLSFTLDPNTSAGVFTEGAATGTMTIRYRATGRSTGDALIKIEGSLYTLGTLFPMRNSDLNP